MQFVQHGEVLVRVEPDAGCRRLRETFLWLEGHQAIDQALGVEVGLGRGARVGGEDGGKGRATGNRGWIHFHVGLPRSCHQFPGFWPFGKPGLARRARWGTSPAWTALLPNARLRKAGAGCYMS